MLFYPSPADGYNALPEKWPLSLELLGCETRWEPDEGDEGQKFPLESLEAFLGLIESRHGKDAHVREIRRVAYAIAGGSRRGRGDDLGFSVATFLQIGE